MKKIFITGCAKSGTTLFKDLFKAMDRTWVIEHEVQLKDFCDLDAEKVGDYDFLVGKRTWNTIYSSSRLTDKDIERNQFLIKDNDIHIINLIRDGRNVVASYNNSWGSYNPFEWMSCIDQSFEYPELIDMTVYYEKVLSYPNEVQKDICDKFGMKRANKFSDYPNFIDFDGHNIRSGGYAFRPFDKAKIEPDRETYLKRPNDIEYFNSLLEKLGYK